MPTPEERASADYARRVINSLLPEDGATRRACLNALAESIELAHTSGPTKWGVTLYHDTVRLNVGHVVPFDLRRHEIFIGLDRNAFNELPVEDRSRFNELVKSQNPESFPSVKEAMTFIATAENLPQVWPIVRDAHASFIKKAAPGTVQLHSKSRSAISPGVLVYLREELQREIPAPAHDGAGSVPAGGGAALTWREELADWLRKNAPTMPDRLRTLREEFVRLFPKERLAEMTLKEYAAGTGRDDNFSYWLEYKTRELGGVGGGSALKTGVWWSKDENRWR